MDNASIEALAEAYWSQHVEPVMRRLTIDAFVSGHAAMTTAYSDWLAAMPGNRAAPGYPAPAAGAPGRTEASGGGEADTARESSDGRAPQAAGEAADAASGDVAPPPAKPLKGLSAATYEIVMRAGRPLLSKELLYELRKWDGRKPTPARDNTLLASMRRLRKAKVIGWDGTHYAPMPAGAPQPGADGRPSE